MDFNHLFRSFFGADHRYDANDHHFGPDFDGLDDHESHLHRDFEDILNTFGQMFQLLDRSSIFDDLNDQNRWQSIEEQPKSPRDLMIRPRDESPQRQRDFDLDHRVNTNGLNELFAKRHDSQPYVKRSPIEIKSFTKTYFYSNFCDNESCEEQTITNDEFGNTKTSVTKRVGDRWLTKVIKRDDKNQVLETQEFTNFEPKQSPEAESVSDQRKPQNNGRTIREENEHKGFWLKDFFGYLFK